MNATQTRQRKGASAAAPSSRNRTTETTVQQLLQMSQAELDELFRNSPAGPIPDGEARGTAIIAPGTEVAGVAAKLIHLFTWQGKVFDARHGTLRNKILPLGHKAIVAQVYHGKSWFDKKECIVLDYSKTSLLAQWVRDEIRQIGPNTYLGIVYWRKTKTIDFALEFPN
jgi:hypothetical protein